MKWRSYALVAINLAVIGMLIVAADNAGDTMFSGHALLLCLGFLALYTIYGLLLLRFFPKNPARKLHIELWFALFLVLPFAVIWHLIN